MKCICSKSIIVLGFLGLKSPVVAFTAKSIASRVAVKYDHVVTNWGGAYQPSTGIFTAPYDGLYSISCTLMSDKSNTVYLEMVKNGERLSMVCAAPYTYPQSSQTLHLILNKGDRVWMQNWHSHSATIHDFNVYNVFSGILIKDL